MHTLEEEIAASPAFIGLPAEQLALIAGCGRHDHAEAGSYLFREGQPAEGFFLIREGAIALEISAPGRSPMVLETLHAGEIAGWSWLFEPCRWHFDGRTTEPTRVITFDGRCLRGKCDADHALGYELMRRFAATAIERLQATRLQLLDVYANPSTR